MWYRRTLLLALVEACGGSVSVPTFQATLSRFCVRRNKNYYDFFPSAHGYQSLVLAQDKRYLASLGFLEDQREFSLQQKHSYLEHLRPMDRQTLLEIVAEPAEGLQTNLFSAQLHMAEETPPVQQKEPLATDKAEQSVCSPGLFTLGYEGLSIDAYLNLLVTSHIAVLVDVRRNSLSRKYGFSKQQLILATRLAGVMYQHIPELGVPSHLRQHLNNETSYRILFEHYATSLLPKHLESIEQVKYLLTEKRRIVLMCFEADPQFCHRHKIVEYLQAEPSFHTPVVHLKTHGSVMFRAVEEIHSHVAQR